MSKHWAQNKEKGNMFFLKITIILVKYCPKILLDFLIKSISFIYFLISQNERRYIQYYRRNLATFSNNEHFFKYGVYKHFHSFAETICDKFAVYQGKIKSEHVDLVNKDFLLKELVNPKKGQIILVSHFGNVEISNAISEQFDGFYMNILLYDKNSQKFNQSLNTFKKNKINFIHVDTLDIASMLKLSKLLDKGEHIGIMGDRIPIKSARVSKVKFLGKEALFPQGAFLLAGLLHVKISTLWTQKINGRYKIELCPLSEQIKLSKDKEKSIRPHLEKYIKELEKRCIQSPYEWYNFFDFWSEDDRV
ncbi:MAG: hypothetical protein KGV43_03245 [Arcobacter sp.]|nr:hypothetical protein [Arcobacter sp.]